MKELIWEELQKEIDWGIIIRLRGEIINHKAVAYKLFSETYDNWLINKEFQYARCGGFVCSIDEYDIEISFPLTGANITHEDAEITAILKDEK